MRYNLSQEQWRTLWENNKSQWNIPAFPDSEELYSPTEMELNNRIKLFNKMFPQLKYNESLNRLDFEKCKGYWGYVEGNEKDITMFLLKL